MPLEEPPPFRLAATFDPSASRRDELNRQQKKIFWIAAAICAISRFAAMARTPWDWDEMLFSLGMREYDVSSHHPHPPGFPNFIAAAKLARLVVATDFRALQAIALLAGMLVFPAVFLFAREIGLRFETSLVAGVLFAFFPNVWFFGGAAFSDVPSIALATFAVVFLFRGARSRRDYWMGTVLLALAAGIRPQNLLVGIFPGLFAARQRPIRDSLIALLIGVTICAAAFGAAIVATGGYDRYMGAVQWHGDYIARVDSFRNPDRPPLWRIFDRFFLKQYQSAALSIVASLFVIVSVVGSIRRRDRAMLFNFLTFAPVAVMTWMMLDRFSISRFSIGYQPMFAIFAADGIARTAGWLSARFGVIRRDVAEYAIGATLAVAFIVFTFPVLSRVRNDITPSVQAVRTVVQDFDPAQQTLYVAYSMVPFMEYFAPSYPMIRVPNELAVPLGDKANAFLLADVTGEDREATFRRARGALWNIARRHYFDVALTPITTRATFGRGWYPAEVEGEQESRVMIEERATITLPAAGQATALSFTIDVPGELAGATLTVSLNGRVLDRFALTGEIARRFEVPPGQHQLELSIDRTAEIDGRIRGARLRSLSWGTS